MKLLLLLGLTLGLSGWFATGCSRDDPKEDKNTDTLPADTGPSDGGSAGSDDADTTDDAVPTCETLIPCAEENGTYTCPDTLAAARSCKTLAACEGTVICASDEEACLVECGRIDCAILDSDPQFVQCPDR